LGADSEGVTRAAGAGAKSRSAADDSFRVARVAAPLRQSVIASLRSAIAAGRFKAGDRLTERDVCEMTGVSRTLVREAPDWRTRIHALGVLDGLDALDAALLRPLLAHASPELRAWAIRWSEKWLREPDHAQSRRSGCSPRCSRSASPPS